MIALATIRITGSLTLVLVVLACAGCAPSSGDEAIEARLYHLLIQTESTPYIPLNGLSETNLAIGKIKFDLPRAFDGTFRMAMMMYTTDGQRILDYFSANHKPGDFDLNIPGIWWETADQKTVHKNSPLVSSRNIVRFAEVFPQFLDKRQYVLQSRQFSTPNFYLRDVPQGTAFIWLETAIDNGHVTQIPMVLELRPRKGQIVRHDIYFDFAQTFFAI
ncbi:MAG: hypothetical protein SGI88_18475 [Candidatus Hydrogenedentes bacterium]|nr:hypothetical protein [Candidatus Hydrogenedentota bacterium]